MVRRSRRVLISLKQDKNKTRGAYSYNNENENNSCSEGRCWNSRKNPTKTKLKARTRTTKRKKCSVGHHVTPLLFAYALRRSRSASCPYRIPIYDVASYRLLLLLLCCCCCLHIKNRSDLYPVPFSFLLFKAKKRISVVTR